MFNNKVYFPPGLCWQCRLSSGWLDTQLLLSPCWPCCGNWEKNRRDLLKTLSIQNVQEVWRGTPWLSEELKPCGNTQIINKTKHKSNHRDETWGIWWRLYLDCVWTHVGWGEGTIVGILTHQPEKNDLVLRSVSLLQWRHLWARLAGVAIGVVMMAKTSQPQRAPSSEDLEK